MERLTERNDSGWLMPSKHIIEKTNQRPARERQAQMLGYFMERLAAYEDTGLTPKEIAEAKKIFDEIMSFVDEKYLSRMEELIQADEEGRVVVVPCNVGDYIWVNYAIQGDYFRRKDRPYRCKIIFVGINGVDPFINFEFSNGRQFQASFSEIGKTIFLTREEAEKALKGVE